MPDAEERMPARIDRGGLPQMEVEVIDGSTVEHGQGEERKAYTGGEKFTCEGGEAMELYQQGHVKIVGVVSE